MLMCDETVTLVHCIQEEDGDIYTCSILHGASWHAATRSAPQNCGLVSKRETKVRVPAANIPIGFWPASGDFMVRGKIDAVTRPAELEAYEHFTVMAVGDNRRGGLPHLAISGE